MSDFLDEVELFLEKVFGKIASPTTSCIVEREIWALFSSKNFCKTGTVALSFVCDKYCPIMD